MRLSDIMSASNLSGYAEVGLLIFMAVFVVIAVRLFLPGKSHELEAMSRMPLEETPLEPRTLDSDALLKETVR